MGFGAGQKWRRAGKKGEHYDWTVGERDAAVRGDCGHGSGRGCGYWLRGGVLLHGAEIEEHVGTEIRKIKALTKGKGRGEKWLR